MLSALVISDYCYIHYFKSIPYYTNTLYTLYFPIYVCIYTGDLFPGMDCPRVGYEVLKEAARVDLTQRGYACRDTGVFSGQVDKVVQMYETQLVRHTVSLCV